MFIKTVARRLAQKKDEDQGFTLIELMVVVLIIAILIAIAIPTFLGARGRAQDRAVQSNLRNALTSAKVIFTDNSSYTGATPLALGAVEPSLAFVGTGVPSTAPKEIQVVSSSLTDVIFSAESASHNKCFYVTDSSSFGTGFAFTNLSCSAAAATAPVAMSVAPAATSQATSGGGWASSW